MSDSPGASPTERFTHRVAHYVRSRPGYPAALVDLLRRECGLGPGKVVADMGSGTGISSELLLRSGCEVVAVEPNEAMREAAEARLASAPGFTSVNAPAEATPLPDRSVDVVFAAQAFHWFEPTTARLEFNRILRERGAVVLVWNQRDLKATAFLRDYEALMMRFGTDYQKIRHENIDDAKLSAFFRGGFTEHALPNIQWLDEDGLVSRVLSCSYVPAQGEPRHEEMVEAIRRLHLAHEAGGKVRIDYVTRVLVGC
jgi:SAM-dependent methyltransferase